MAQGSPINDILQMRQQGISNNQIIQNLQRAGYTNTQIFDAMNQADTKMAVEGVQPGVLNPAETTGPNPNLFTTPPSDVQSAPFMQQPAEFTQPEPMQPQVSNNELPGAPDYSKPQMPDFSQDFGDTQLRVEELVEAIIEEKWEELIRDVNKIVEWKNKMESKVSEMQVKLDALRDNFAELNKAVIGKVNEYDRHILEVGSDIKAMEKVFSKVLPSFTENVNELSRIAEKFRGDIE